MTMLKMMMMMMTKWERRKQSVGRPVSRRKFAFLLFHHRHSHLDAFKFTFSLHCWIYCSFPCLVVNNSNQNSNEILMNPSFSNGFEFFRIFRIFQTVFRPCSKLYFEPRKIHNIVLNIKKITKKIQVGQTLFVATVHSCCSMIVVIIITGEKQFEKY